MFALHMVHGMKPELFEENVSQSFQWLIIKIKRINFVLRRCVLNTAWLTGVGGVYWYFGVGNEGGRRSRNAFLDRSGETNGCDQPQGRTLHTANDISLKILILKFLKYYMIFQWLQTNFPKLYQVLNFDDGSLWSSFSRSNECEKEFPSVIEKRISLFQQLLVVQAVRPDRLQTAMGLFACKALGLCISLILSFSELVNIFMNCHLQVQQTHSHCT